jgi:hypothetical protein
VSPQALERTDKAIEWLIEITAGAFQKIRKTLNR